MELRAPEDDEWEVLRDKFRAAGLCWESGGDSLVWDRPTTDGVPVVKDIYRGINVESYQGQITRSFSGFWRRKIPNKIVVFGWLVWKDKVLTGNNLIKRGYSGPFRCQICCADYESTIHLFFRCPIIIKMWRLFFVHFMGPTWSPVYFISAATEWDNLKGKYRSLPFFLMWEVWLGRNKLIFENVPFQIPRIFSAILKWIEDRPMTIKPITDFCIRIRPHEVAIPSVYFDGACREGDMGCGSWIKLSQRERIHIHWNGGQGTNNKAEVIALWGGLRFAAYLQLQDIHVYGDSKIFIGWITNLASLIPTELQGWVHSTRHLW